MKNKILFQGKILLTVLLFCFTSSHLNAQCNQFNQSEFESRFLELTEQYVNNFQISSSEAQKSKYIDGYLKQVEEIFCYGLLKAFKGQFREIDSLVVEELAEEYSRLTGEKKEIDPSDYADGRYSIIISNQRGRIWTPEEKRVKYEFTFGDNSPLLKELLKLKRGDDVTFSFRFKEDLTRYSLPINLETKALIKALGKEIGVAPEFPIELVNIKVDPK